MRHSFVVAFAILGIVSFSCPRAETVTVRAIGPHAPEALTRYIARNAQPIALDPAALKKLPDRTPREVIQTLCGWLPIGYYPVFIDANKAAIHEADRWPLLDSQKIGALSTKLVWPACLYTHNKAARERVLPSDTPRSIYIRLVGGDGTNTALRNFYGQVHESLGSVQTKIRNGQPVSAPWATVAVGLAPKPKVKLEDFQAGMNRAAASDNYATPQVIRNLPPGGGRFVTDADDDGTHGTDTPQCRMKNQAPYNSAALALAYSHSYNFQKNRNLAPSRVDVVVVDNGFFGVDPRNAPFFSVPFEKSYFPLWLEQPLQLVGPAVSLDAGSVYPSNFLYMKGPTNLVSGHGTHVTGLVLGGTYLAPADRQTIFSRNSGSTWMSLSILNTGEGADAPISGALGRLWRDFGPLNFVNAHRNMFIINLSLMLFGKADATSVADINTFLQSDTNDLFIVAAGNGPSHNISEDKIYPAADGGQGAANVVTVGALDWSNSYSQFTVRDPNFVDITAPGCGITSWIDNKSSVKSLSGTSQATPLVTFAAALLSSLDGSLTAGDIKRRLIVSGDPIVLRPGDVSTWSGVRLNIPVALYLFEDYVRFDRNDGTGVHEYLGKLTDVKNVICNGVNIYDDDIWSYKSDGVRRLLFRGRNIPQSLTAPPCQLPSKVNSHAQFIFVASAEIKTGRIQSLAANPNRAPLPPLPLSTVSSLVRGIPTQ